MKKVSITLVLSIICIFFAGCNSHEHAWKDATCTEPKTCTECGETEGEPLGHKWTDATCTEAKKCTVCGATEGKPKGHTWVDATCTSPKTCSVCGATEGSKLDHKWKEATCTKPKTCSLCGATEGEPLGHDVGISCTEKTTCKRCGATVEPLGHDWKEATCTEAKTCARCGTIEGKPLGHDGAAPVKENEVAATCTAAGSYEEVGYCTRCHEEVSRVKKTVEPLGHTTDNGACTRCGATVVKPIMYSGHGKDVITGVDVPNGLYRVVMTNSGNEHFSVITYDENGEYGDLLANDSGSSFVGEAVYREAEIKETKGWSFEVDSKSDWTIKIEAISRQSTSNMKGYGSVITDFFTGQGLAAVKMTNSGKEHFSVIIYDSKGKYIDLLANDSGSSFSGKSAVKLDPSKQYFLAIDSESEWTVDFGFGDSVTEYY